jgi:phosphoadenosine phosphosulfate reductase
MLDASKNGASSQICLRLGCWLMDTNEREAFAAYAQLPQFKRKVERSLEVIREALAIGPAYVAVSWGKDSVVMLHLCQQVQPDILAVNIGDSLEDLQDNYSEVTADYCNRFRPNYQRILYEEDTDGGFFEQIKKLYDLRKMAMIGCRAEENKRRASAIKKFGAIHQYKSGANAGMWRAFPIAYWGWKDIWSYTCLHDLPYLRSYDHPLSGSRQFSRTAVIHNFDLHRGKHQEALIRHGAFTRLRVTAPEYYRLYADLYPEIKNNG